MTTPIALIIGAILGFVAEWLMDTFFWRNRRVCSENEQRLLESERNLRASLDTAESDYKTLQLEADGLRESSVNVAEYDAKIEAKDAELAKLSKSYEDKEKALFNLEGRLNTLEGERDSLSAKISRIQGGELDDVDTSGWDWGKLGLAAGGGALAGYISRDSDELRDLEAKVGSLEAERDDLSARLTAAQSDTSASDELNARIVTLEGERDDLSARLAAVEGDTSATDELNARIVALEAERDEMAKRIEVADNEATENQALMHKIDGLEKERDEMAKRIEAANNEATENQALMHKVDDLEKERDDLAAKLASAKADASASADLEARIRKVSGERDDLYTRLSKLESGELDDVDYSGWDWAKYGLVAAGGAAAGAAASGRDWADLTTGSPELGSFGIDANDVASGTFTLEGTGEPGANVAVQVGETVLGRTAVQADSNWRFSEKVSVPAGVHEVWARMIDGEGRTMMEAQSRSIKLQRRPAKPDDLTKIYGIGPKFSKLLNTKGISTFVQLANASLDDLRVYIDEADYQSGLANEEEWSHQARLLATGQTKELKEYQDKLRAERKAAND